MNERDAQEYAALMSQQRSVKAASRAIERRMAELQPPAPKRVPYRIALRPDEHGADPMDLRTLVDDIVVNDVAVFRAEQMGRDNWWVACYLDEHAKQEVTWHVRARSKPLRIEWVTTQFPDVTYEHELKAAHRG